MQQDASVSVLEPAPSTTCGKSLRHWEVVLDASEEKAFLHRYFRRSDLILGGGFDAGTVLKNIKTQQHLLVTDGDISSITEDEYREMTVLISVHAAGCKVVCCDVKCYDAIEPNCKCLCGGRNHGKGRDQAIRNTRNFAETMIAEYVKRHELKKYRSTVSRDVYQLP